MKKVLLTSLLALLVTAGTTMKAQDRANEYLGLPGDNLNLYAVMNLFQESETLEDFERNLNDENSRINNLDLNGDNYVDYISVNDYKNGNVHTIVMQVALNRSEKQDVGVFTVERFRDNSVQIQLIGDEALYGRNYIIEPFYAETANPGYTGNARNRAARTTYVEVSAWPVVRFIYEPHYTVWRSSWYWGYYPHWYNTWTPFYYHHYYGYHYNYYDHYYAHYRHWHTPRWSGYHNNYYSRVRIASPLVVININKGAYKQTYSRPESRRDGEVLYARTQATRNSTLSNGSNRRSSVTESTTRTREAAGTTRRAESTTVSRSSGARTTTPASTRSASERTATPNRSVSQTTSASRSAAERPVSARTSTPENRSVTTRSSGSAARPSASENRGAATRSSNSTARPASTENRSVTARPSSAPARSTEARSSAPSQNRESTARSSSSGQNRSTSAGSSSAPRQQSASAPRSSSRESAPAARSSNRSSTKSESSSSSTRKSEESRSRR